MSIEHKGDSSVKKPPISITIKDKNVLYSAYMYFLKSGGLFIPIAKQFAMSEEVSLLVSLLDEPDKYEVEGRVVWITPSGSHGNKAGGVGIEFKGDNGEQLRKKIETILAGILKSDEATHTM